MVPAIYPYLCIQPRKLYICPCKFSHVSWFNVDLVKPDWKKWEIEYPPDTTSSMSPDYRKTHKLTAGIGKNHLNPTFILGGGPNLNFHFGSFLDFKILREMYTSHVHQKRNPSWRGVAPPLRPDPVLAGAWREAHLFFEKSNEEKCGFVKRFKRTPWKINVWNVWKMIFRISIGWCLGSMLIFWGETCSLQV